MTIVIQIVLALIVVGVTVWLTAVYWRRLYGRLKHASHLQRMRDHVFSQKRVKAQESRLDFMEAVLQEVQKQHEGMTSYLRLLTSDDINPSQQEWKIACDRVNERASVLTETVDSTLEVMRYEQAETIERNDDVLVNAFCQDVFDSCEPFHSGDVELRLETGMYDDEIVRTNMKALQKVLTNLIRCAMHFTHEGEIVLKVKPRRKNEQNIVQFTIADTGIGIPEDSKDLVFEQLPPNDAVMKLVVVRLRLCRALVRLLGGNIYLDPTRDHGTAVVFTIKE